MSLSCLKGCVDESWNTALPDIYSSETGIQTHDIFICVDSYNKIKIRAGLNTYPEFAQSQRLDITLGENSYSNLYSRIKIRVCELSITQTRANPDSGNQEICNWSDNWITQPRAECDILRREYGITVEQPALFSPKWNLPATVRLMFHYEITKIHNDEQVDLDSPVRENTKGFEPFGFHALNDFESMLNDETTADVAIKTTLGKEKSFNCHKFILAARSEVFRAMFQCPMKESAENVIVIDDIRPETMGHFLSFLYCGRFQDKSWMNCLPSLTHAAEKYCLTSLKHFCDLNLIKGVTCENAIAVADFALRHDLKTALRHIRNFIARNVGDLTLDLEKDAAALELNPGHD